MGESIYSRFALLSDIGSEKVYVVGNHDEALSELREEVDEVALPNDTKFVIRNKHYPDDHNGLKIGNISYFFVHGQQFDKEQAILAWMKSTALKLFPHNKNE